MEIKLTDLHSKQVELMDLCLDDNNFFIIGVIGRQFGKTLFAVNMAVYWSLNDPGSVVYWVSPTDSQALKVYKQIINAIIESGCIKHNKQGKGDTEIEFKNGSIIYFKSAQSEDNLRGAAVNYMILDEAAFVKRSTVETILLPMTIIKGKKILFITTPKGKNYIYDYYNNGLTKNRWACMRCSTYDSPLATKDMIQMFKDTLNEKMFKQEVEADFVDSSGVFNNVEELMVLPKLLEPFSGETYYAGIDIGLLKDASVVAIVDSKGNMVNYSRWVSVDSSLIIKNIVALNDKWHFEKIFIEDNNQGLVIYQSLEKILDNIQRFNTNSKTKGEIINNLIHQFNTKSFLLLKDELLRIELEAFIFIQNDIGTVKFMADSGFSDDIVMALAIVKWNSTVSTYDSSMVRFWG